MFPYHHVLFVSFCPFFQTASWSTSLLKNSLEIKTSGILLKHPLPTWITSPMIILFQIKFWNTSNIQNKSLNESLPICCHIFFHNDWHISERHLHRFIFQVVGIPRSVFPILGQKMSFFSKRKFGKRIFVQFPSQGNTFQQNHHQSVRTCFFSLKGFPNALPETSTAIEFCWVELLWPLSGGENPSGRCRKTSMPGENWLS